MTEQNEFIVVFQTLIDGQVAQCEISTDVDPMNSKAVRAGLEMQARMSFQQLSNKFVFNQKITAAEIVKVKASDFGYIPPGN